MFAAAADHEHLPSWRRLQLAPARRRKISARWQRYIKTSPAASGGSAGAGRGSKKRGSVSPARWFKATFQSPVPVSEGRNTGLEIPANWQTGMSRPLENLVHPRFIWWLNLRAQNDARPHCQSRDAASVALHPEIQRRNLRRNTAARSWIRLIPPCVTACAARDIAVSEAVEINLVVVHGGGKHITRAMEAAGLKANFIQGMQVR